MVGVDVIVTSVNGDQANFDVVLMVNKDQVASEISDRLARQVGRKPDSVTCPENLKVTEGSTLECDLTDQGQTYEVTVTVASADSANVSIYATPAPGFRRRALGP